MDCRCGDIRRCRTDIRRIRGAIIKMEGLRGIDSTIKSDLLGVAKDNFMYMTPYNIGNITETDLNDELEDMIDEDYDYHHRDED